MKVYIEREDKTVEVKAKNVKEILNKLKINSNSVLVARNKELVTEDCELKDSDKIEILSVVSGG